VAEVIPYRYWRSSPPLPSGADVDRFWSYVVVGSPDECWPWRTRKRGLFWWRDSSGKRHHQVSPRLAFRLATGTDFGPRQVVAHRCDWNACCNPAHLEAASQRKNTRDMATRGLHPYMASSVYRDTRENWWRAGSNGPGEANGFSKLTDEAVQAIRRRYASNAVRQVDLAREFGVGQSTISRVLRHASWSHVTDSRG